MGTKKFKLFEKKKIKNLFLSGIALLLLLATSFVVNEFHLMSNNKSITDVIGENIGENVLPLESSCSVHFINVGQGDSALIISNNKTILIDAGEVNQDEVVCEYLEKYKIKKIDLLIGTHPHSDHIGGMSKVIKRFDIGKIVMPKVPDEIVPTSSVYTNLLKEIQKKNLKITPAKIGDKYTFGAGTIEILAPIAKYNDLNNNSIVAKFTYGKKTFLFTGDIEKQAEKDILNQYKSLKADVIKIAHHGSNTSSTQKFLNAVNPNYAVISLAGNNTYGFPSKKTMERIEKINPQIFRTSIDGTIVFQIIDGRLKINSTGI